MARRRGPVPKPPEERRSVPLGLSMRPRDVAALDGLRQGTETRQAAVYRLLEPLLHPHASTRPPARLEVMRAHLADRRAVKELADKGRVLLGDAARPCDLLGFVMGSLGWEPDDHLVRANFVQHFPELFVVSEAEAKAAGPTHYASSVRYLAGHLIEGQRPTLRRASGGSATPRAELERIVDAVAKNYLERDEYVVCGIRNVDPNDPEAWQVTHVVGIYRVSAAGWTTVAGDDV